MGLEANGESRVARDRASGLFARAATRRTVSQITFGERSRRRTLAGRRFGITYSPGLFSPSSHART